MSALDHLRYHRHLDAHVDGELSGELADRVANHIAWCRWCQPALQLTVRLKDGLSRRHTMSG